MSEQRTKTKQFKQLDAALIAAVEEYFRQVKGTRTSRHLYQLVFTRIEKVLFEYLLKREDYNQSKVCDTLGISRSTLRTKLRKYGIRIPRR